MAKKSKGRKLQKPGKTFTKKVTRGPNKGDTVSFKIARGGKPFPTRVVKDVGKPSTLNKSIPRGRKKKAKKK